MTAPLTEVTVVTGASSGIGRSIAEACWRKATTWSTSTTFCPTGAICSSCPPRPTLRACGQGRIVNMSSCAALGKVDRIVHSATKAGMIGMTRTLAMKLGRDGITVNALGPGPSATELFRKSSPEGAWPMCPTCWSPIRRSPSGPSRN
ncbi:MAG: SDR family NAD(P)-dependent oxidoreductase [Burkholderiales bacterium]|nr:SDR family NAD(P)-dependent oxidoreductase [Burkholderiales bacterium]